MAGGLVSGLRLSGEAGALGRVARLEARAGDLSPAFERMAELVEAHLAEVFETEGAAGGSRWPALNSKYAARKSKYYGAGLKILERDGELREALTREGAAGHVRDVTRTGLVVGGKRPAGKVDLARLHQQGVGRLPARRLLELPEAVRRRLTEIAREYLAEGLASGKSGGG